MIRKLSRLEQAGYIHIEKTFEGKIPRTVCSMTEAGQAAFRAYLEKMKGALGNINSIQ
ncbi:MAG TPA: transcriptional regulator [Anaerolineales bacterium]|nr:transcriptional regulator [Anaerolineales bacterium]